MSQRFPTDLRTLADAGSTQAHHQRKRRRRGQPSRASSRSIDSILCSVALQSAAHVDRLTSDVICLGRAKEEHDVGDFVRPGRAAHWDSGNSLPKSFSFRDVQQPRLFFVQLLPHGRGCNSGTDRVDGDAMPGEGQRQGPREIDDGGFARCIGRSQRPAAASGGRGDIDDLAAPALSTISRRFFDGVLARLRMRPVVVFTEPPAKCRIAKQFMWDGRAT